MTTCPHCGALHLAVEELVGDKHVDPTQRRILEALSLDRIKTYDSLTHILWGHSSDGGPDNPRQLIAVQLSRLRKKLHGSGYEIETVWGVGLRMRRVSILTRDDDGQPRQKRP